MQQVNNLIAANRVYTCSVISSDGIVFKNGEGSTTLIAVVKNGGLNIADQFNIQWYKDGEELSLGAEVTVNAADVPDKVTYRFEATDSGGIFRGQYEVTVSNVNDGEKGADGEPGKAGEDGVSPIIKEKYGYVPDDHRQKRGTDHANAERRGCCGSVNGMQEKSCWVRIRRA